MTRADRAFLQLVLASAATGVLLAIPLVLTLLPAALHQALHRAEGLVQFCAALIAALELPPLGAVVLALTAATALVASARAARMAWLTRRALAHRTAVPPPARVRRAARRVGIGARVSCFADARPRAYCAGLLRPRVWISSGAARRLGQRELEAVLWHEANHVRRRDPLRLAVVRVLRSAMFAVPLIGALADRFETAKELDADDAALRAQGGPRALAGALLELSGAPRQPAWAVGAAPLSRARVDQLCGVTGEYLPAVSARAAWLTAATLAVALCLSVGQAVRAQLVPAGTLELLRGTASVTATSCPLPPDGILL